MTWNNVDMCLILTFQRNVWLFIFNKYLNNKDTEIILILVIAIFMHF